MFPWRTPALVILAGLFAAASTGCDSATDAHDMWKNTDVGVAFTGPEPVDGPSVEAAQDRAVNGVGDSATFLDTPPADAGAPDTAPGSSDAGAGAG